MKTPMSHTVAPILRRNSTATHGAAASVELNSSAIGNDTPQMGRGVAKSKVFIDINTGAGINLVR